MLGEKTQINTTSPFRAQTLERGFWSPKEINRGLFNAIVLKAAVSRFVDHTVPVRGDALRPSPLAK